MDSLRGLRKEIVSLFKDDVGIILSDNDYEELQKKMLIHFDKNICASRYWAEAIGSGVSVVSIGGVNIRFVSESKLIKIIEKNEK